MNVKREQIGVALVVLILAITPTVYEVMEAKENQPTLYRAAPYIYGGVFLVALLAWKELT